MRSKIAVLVLVGSLATAGGAQAFFLNFESGTEGARVDDIAGISFQNYGGYAPMYADIRTGYNAHSDDLNYGSGSYHMNGYFSVWAGPEADARGVKIDFTSNDGTWFQTGYAAASNFYIDAFFTDGSNTSVSGASNLGSPMGFLRVDATDGKLIDYVVLHDSGNFWTVDDMSGDSSRVGTVPEPGTLVLLGTGLLGVTGFARRRKNP